MAVHSQVLPTLTQILALERLEHLEFDLDRDTTSGSKAESAADRERSPHPPSLPQAQRQAETEWYAAIASLNQLLAQGLARYPLAMPTDSRQPVQGVILSSPSPVLSNPDLAAHFADWVLIPEPIEQMQGLSLRLPTSDRGQPGRLPDRQILPVFPHDPLAAEQFCLVLTSEFNLALVLGWDGGQPLFQFSFDPAIVAKAWQAIQLRLMIASPQSARQVDVILRAFAAVEPDYRCVAQFSRGMMHHFAQANSAAIALRRALVDYSEDGAQPASEPTTAVPPTAARSLDPTADPTATPATNNCPDTELLQAMAHEIRTPLTTIRTLTRSLLRRSDLDAKVLQRLGQIDHECTRQIDRFSLIFRAAELENQHSRLAWGSLSATALDHVFQDSIPAWQHQARQRQIQLDVVLPTGLPLVVSDPTMLTQMLTGLIDRFTHSLPAGSQLQFEVTLAGHQLKLQFTSNLQPSKSPARTANCPFTPPAGLNAHQAFRAIGQLLMLQPETGNLSLNLAATKNLFQALGGKLIVKQRPEQGEVLTIFLPLSKSY